MKPEASKVDIGILTVVPDEFRAIRDYFSTQPNFVAERRGQKANHRFMLGTMSSSGSEPHTIAVLRAGKQGNCPIQKAYEYLRDEYNPTFIVLLGMGGAFSSKLKLCDVMVGTSVIDYDLRAVNKDGAERTGNALPPIPPWVLDMVDRVKEEHGEDLSFKAHPNSLEENFSVRTGPITSGDAVIKDADADEKEYALYVSRKTLGTEMESKGLVESFLC